MTGKSVPEAFPAFPPSKHNPTLLKGSRPPRTFLYHYLSQSKQSTGAMICSGSLLPWVGFLYILHCSASASPP